MPNTERYYEKKKNLEKLKVPRGNKSVLIKTLAKNIDSRTPSGIWKISETDTDWSPSTHADRWGEVIAIPSYLPFKVNEDLAPWETAVQICEGMLVWYDYLNSLNCVTYTDEEGSEYKLIDYENLYVATVPNVDEYDFDLPLSEDDGEYIIPLNGFTIFERVYKDNKTGSIINALQDVVDNNYGIVKYVSQKNVTYENGREHDHVDLQVGDKVMFSTVPAVTLEDEAHCVFDGGRMYRRAQARNVDVIWRGDEMIVPEGRVLLKRIVDEEVTESGLILLKANVKSHTGNVLVSSIPEAPVGSEVLYTMGAGMLIDYKGEECRIVNESSILYVK